MIIFYRNESTNSKQPNQQKTYISNDDCKNVEISSGYIDVDKFEKCMKSKDMSIYFDESNGLIEDVKAYITAYVNEDIMRDPPNQLKKHHLLKELDKLKRKQYAYFYDLWVEIQYILNQMMDPHLSLQFMFRLTQERKIIGQIYYELDREIKEGDKPGEGLSIRTNAFFTTYEKIKSINGTDVVDWLIENGIKHGSFKSIHNQYKSGIKYLQNGNIALRPLSYDELRYPMIIETEKNKKFECHYKLQYSSSTLFLTDEDMIYDPAKLVDYYCPSNVKKKFVYDKKYISCVDDKKRINIIIVTSFRADNTTEIDNYIGTIDDSFDTIDSNNNPIMVIMKKNPGGNVFICQYLLKKLNTYQNVDLYGRYRTTNVANISDTSQFQYAKPNNTYNPKRFIVMQMF